MQIKIQDTIIQIKIQAITMHIIMQDRRVILKLTVELVTLVAVLVTIMNSSKQHRQHHHILVKHTLQPMFLPSLSGQSGALALGLAAVEAGQQQEEPLSAMTNREYILTFESFSKY